MRISQRCKMGDCGDYSISRRCRAFVGRQCDETSNYLDMFPRENRRHRRCPDFFRMHRANDAVNYPSMTKTVIATDASSRDKIFSNRAGPFVPFSPTSSVFAEFTSSIKHRKLVDRYSHWSSRKLPNYIWSSVKISQIQIKKKKDNTRWEKRPLFKFPWNGFLIILTLSLSESRFAVIT